jgi:hypothetical protein
MVEIIGECPILNGKSESTIIISDLAHVKREA